MESCDFDAMSRYALRRRHSLSERQLQEFVEELPKLLSRSFSERVYQTFLHQTATVEIVEVRDLRPGFVKVVPLILGEASDGIEIAYMLAQEEDRWRLIDASFEGASLVRNYNVQIKQLVEDGSPEELVLRIREMNQEFHDAPAGSVSP